MRTEVVRVESSEIDSLREIHRAAMNCQIIHWSRLERGFANAYLITAGGSIAGYGLVGGARGDPKNTIIEFFVAPEARDHAAALFNRLIEASSAKSIAAQTNDLLLTRMLQQCCDAAGIERTRFLFEAGTTTRLSIGGVAFRRSRDADSRQIFEHRSEPVGEWLLETGAGEIVATGGFLTHYNEPYADIHMEVAEAHRRRGYGSFLVQELKRVCVEQGLIPAARCNVSNAASRATLLKAGMRECGAMMKGVLGTKDEQR